MGPEDVPSRPAAHGAGTCVCLPRALASGPRRASSPPGVTRRGVQNSFPYNLLPVCSLRLGAPRGQGLGLTRRRVPQCLAHAVWEAGG